MNYDILQEKDLGLGADGRTILEDLKEIDINMRSRVDLAQVKDYWRAPCECGIKLPDSTIYGVK